MLRALLALLLSVSIAACSGGLDQYGADGGLSPGAEAGAAVTDASPGIDAVRVADFTCGGTDVPVEPAHPNMLVVFDRSCSMRRQHASPKTFGTHAGDPSTRWHMARQALDKVTAAHQNRVRFGLMVFPRPAQGCGDAPALNVKPGLVARAAINKALDSASVNPFTLCPAPGASSGGAQPQVTPTAEAITAAGKVQALQDTKRESMILLMTDGYATCGASAGSLGAQVAGLSSKKIKTVVVGFGDAETATALSMLDAMATAGGAPQTGAKTKFWLASSPATLQAALNAIVSDAISCTFSLKKTPPDPKRLFAFLDGKLTPSTGAHGWSYDSAANAVTFKGDTCKRLRAGQVKNVSLVFGCPKPKCVPKPVVGDGYYNDCDGQVDEQCLK